ncbi:MAG TPA: hypothetical protein VHE10_01195, partial [Candidatus Paceibacterota bacterium]|nr:hypothetical protein [Candidatus Paceibacterota bacterium]
RDWSVNSFGALAPTTTRGIFVTASSTIGNGAQTGGLTINGGATTTGSAYFGGNIFASGNITGNLITNDLIKNSTNDSQLSFQNSNVQLLPGGAAALTALVSGNVGIGTTSPGSLLSVGGIANFTAGTSTFYSAGGLNISNGCYAMNGACLSTGSLGLTGTQGQVAYFSGTNAAVGTSSLFIGQSGNVGIGTSTPFGLLSINPNGITGPAFVIGSSTKSHLTVTEGGLIRFGSTTNAASFVNINGDGYALSNAPTVSIQSANAGYNNGQLRLFRDNNEFTNFFEGDVGGTGNNGLTINVQSAGTGRIAMLFNNNSSSYFTANGWVIANNATGNDQIAIDRSTNSIDLKDAFSHSRAKLGALNQISGPGYLQLTDSLDTIGVLINASSTSYINNGANFGVGTTSPAAKLSVQGNGLFSGNISAANLVATGTATTTNLSILGLANSLLKTNSLGQVVAASASDFWGTSSQNYYASQFRDWSVNSFGALAPTTTRGIFVTASSTIGNGAQTGGLTINGGATTTG